MEGTISRLLKTYEDGALFRRDLVRGLALLAAASGSAPAAELKPNGINHVSICVSDLQRSSDFYQRVFGGVVQKRDGSNLVTVGKGRLVLRLGKPAGRIDHIAIGIDNFNQESTVAELKARGAVAVQEADVGLNVKDPDGFPIQVIANAP